MEKTNVEIHGYSPEPICEAHAHMFYPRPVNDTISTFKNIMRHFNYSKILLAQVAMRDTTENMKGLYVKENLEGAYSLGSLNHYFDERDTAEYFLEEIKKYHAMGCDGIKMLEGKPSDRLKLYAPRLDSKVYEKFFEYAEANSVPIMMHLGDPLEMWDLSKMSQYAIEHGWYCGGEGRPSREDLRSEAENVLKKFPKLRLCFAHFYFMEDDLERAARLFDTYPNLSFDLCIGSNEVYSTFTKRHDDWKRFFEKYSDRLFYGTDTYHFALDGMNEEQRYGVRINLARTYLETQKEFTDTSISPDCFVKPLALDKKHLDNIYRNNFIRRYGSTPKAVDYEMALFECKKICAERQLDEMMRDNMKIVTDFFAAK